MTVMCHCTRNERTGVTADDRGGGHNSRIVFTARTVRAVSIPSISSTVAGLAPQSPQRSLSTARQSLRSRP